MSKQATQKTNIFKGFDSPIAVFRVGNHTDSAGTPVEITDDDLNQMVTNFDQDQVPYVVGHPKDDAPAYGWASNVFVKEGVLYTESANVAPEFEEAVEAGRYRNRSVSIAKNDDGQWYLRHIGFLGAAAPAVKGLERMAFNDDDEAVTFEFSDADLNDAARSGGWAMSSIAALFRNMKNALIEAVGADKAEEQIPEYELDSISRGATKLTDVPYGDLAHMYSDPNLQNITPTQNNDGDTMSKTPVPGQPAAKSFTEADVQARELAAAEKAAEAKFAHKQTCKDFANKLEAEGKILPRQIEEVARFLEAQSAEQSFNFTEADSGEEKSISTLNFAMQFMAAMPAQFADLKTAAAGLDTDPGQREAGQSSDLVKQANAFQAEQKAAGVEISFAEALDHITAEADDE